MKAIWKRPQRGYYNLVVGKDVIGRIEYREYDRRWYPYRGDNDEPDGIRFDSLWEAKDYIERKVLS